MNNSFREDIFVRVTSLHYELSGFYKPLGVGEHIYSGNLGFVNTESKKAMFSQAWRKGIQRVHRLPFPSRGLASTALPGSGGGGSTFMQRMMAFLAGLGVGCGGSFFVIYEELGNSNARFTKHFHDLQKRVDALEAK